MKLRNLSLRIYTDIEVLNWTDWRRVTEAANMLSTDTDSKEKEAGTAVKELWDCLLSSKGKENIFG